MTDIQPPIQYTDGNGNQIPCEFRCTTELRWYAPFRVATPRVLQQLWRQVLPDPNGPYVSSTHGEWRDVPTAFE